MRKHTYETQLTTDSAQGTMGIAIWVDSSDHNPVAVRLDLSSDYHVGMTFEQGDTAEAVLLVLAKRWEGMSRELRMLASYVQEKLEEKPPEKWRVISVDNLNREGPGYDDKIIADGLERREFADTMADALNQKFCRYDDDRFFKVVDQSYTLQVFEP